MAAQVINKSPIVFTRSIDKIDDRLDVHFNELKWDNLYKKLDDLVSKYSYLSLDQAVKQFNVGLTTAATKYYCDDGVLFLRGENVYANKLELGNKIFVPVEQHKEWISSQVEPGFIVLNLVGNIGDACVIPPEIECAQINRALGRIIPDETKASGQYILEFLNSGLGRGQLVRFSQGGMQRRFNHPDGKFIKVPIIGSDNEKKYCDRISQVRNRCESSITKINKRIESHDLDLLDEISHVYERHFNLPKIERINSPVAFLKHFESNQDRLDTLYNTPGHMRFIERLSSCGHLITLGEIVSLSKEKIDGGSITSYIGLEHICKFSGQYSVEQCESGEYSSGFKIKAPAVLYGRLRPYLNKVACIKEKIEDVACSTEFYICECDSSQYLEALSFYLRSWYGFNQLKYLPTGGSLPRVQEEDFLKVRAPHFSKYQDIDSLLLDLKNCQKKYEIRVENTRKVINSIEEIIDRISSNPIELLQHEIYTRCLNEIEEALQ
ncbi:hypothetical protein GS910_01640 [Paraburkholderia sp. RL16-012-BIC-B]|nr:hypothetical protein [Paraburkholderia madseniana]NPT62964.1 hypothetical protein [Paraburkholderia madseniana]